MISTRQPMRIRSRIRGVSGAARVAQERDTRTCYQRRRDKARRTIIGLVKVERFGGEMSGVPEFDPNKVAAELAQNLIKDTSKLLTAGVRDFFRRLGDALQKNIKPYLEATINKCSVVKTLIINRDGPSKLFDIYVHTRVFARGREIQDDNFISELPALKSVVIEGSGGAGKSMLMRYLFISLCNNFIGKLPLFVELRTLNTFQTRDLLAFVHHSITGPVDAAMTREQFNAGLRAGSFCIILDGFDEVDVDHRTNIEKQILALRDQYPELIIIVSSRPDPEDRFNSWSKFHVCRVLPMSREQVDDLIDKLDYDTVVKAKFLKALDALFRTHQSFLSNPLLCIMMLITFEQYGHIPDKMHIFYEHAFDALFFRHDATKEGAYRRQTHGKLPIDEFRDCLSAFCLVSYSKERISFTNVEVHETIKQALAIEQKDVAGSDFLNDLVEAVCLLQMEGLQYQFTHRSFQEYFVACFIGRSPPNLRSMLDHFSRRRQDEVIPMAFAMNRRLIEREWIIPKLKEFRDVAENVNPKTDLVAYANQVFGGLQVHHQGRSKPQYIYRGLTPFGQIMLLIARLYPQRFPLYDDSKDAAPFKAALAAMVKTKDPRISATPTDKIRAGSFELAAGDAWVTKTGLTAYFVGQKVGALALLTELEGAASEQVSVLNDLV